MTKTFELKDGTRRYYDLKIGFLREIEVPDDDVYNRYKIELSCKEPPYLSISFEIDLNRGVDVQANDIVGFILRNLPDIVLMLTSADLS